jgi:hypothetical protein
MRCCARWKRRPIPVNAITVAPPTWSSSSETSSGCSGDGDTAEHSSNPRFGGVRRRTLAGRANAGARRSQTSGAGPAKGWVPLPIFCAWLPGSGFEPPTGRETTVCSSAELPGKTPGYCAQLSENTQSICVFRVTAATHQLALLRAGAPARSKPDIASRSPIARSAPLPA